MKKSELVEIIRTVVKEEIETSLPQYLKEVLAESLVGQASTKKVVESVQSPVAVKPSQPRKPVSVGLDAPIKQAPAQAPKLFTNNPILNQVLNETVGGVPLEESTPSAIDTLQSLPKEVLSENKEVAAVANALTRDYSKLLKAVDAKAKAQRPA